MIKHSVVAVCNVKITRLLYHSTSRVSLITGSSFTTSFSFMAYSHLAGGTYWPWNIRPSSIIPRLMPNPRSLTQIMSGLGALAK